MPKQTIHLGRMFHLVPLVQETNTPDDYVRPLDSYVWGSGWPAARTKDDGIIVDQEPSLELNWSKGRGSAGDDPGDEGYVDATMLVTESWLRRQVAQLDVWDPSTPKPEFFRIQSGPLSWRDLNVLARTARDARDQAFGKPE